MMQRSLNQSSLEESRIRRSARTVCEFEEYFSCDEILMLSERTPVVVSKEVTRLGFLDPSSDEENLKKNTKLELPLWLAKHLYNMYCVDIQLPEAFNSYSVNVMRADSSIVDLKRLQPNYYQVGRQLMALLPAEAQQISDLLVTTYKGRFRKIFDGAQNADVKETDKVTSSFDNEERAMFFEGQKVQLDLQRWRDRSQRNKINTAELVVNHRKRKREALKETNPSSN